MDERLKNVDLIDELNETYVDVTNQLMEDEKRYGDTWKEQGLVYEDLDQETRWFNKMRDYYLDFLDNGTPIPWLKVFGETHICYVREKKLKNGE